MAAAIRIQLGNASVTTGGAGFAGFSAKSDSVGEVSALRKKVQELERQQQALEAKFPFKCERHGLNSTHNTQDCKVLKGEMSKDSKARGGGKRA